MSNVDIDLFTVRATPGETIAQFNSAPSGVSIKKGKKKDFIFHMRILNDIYPWKEKYPAYARVEDPL